MTGNTRVDKVEQHTSLIFPVKLKQNRETFAWGKVRFHNKQVLLHFDCFPLNELRNCLYSTSLIANTQLENRFGAGNSDEFWWITGRASNFIITDLICSAMLPIWKLWAVLLFLLCPTHDPRRAVLKRERGNRWVTHTVTHTQSSHTDWLRDMAHRWLLESASICHAEKSVAKTHHFKVSGTRWLLICNKL